MLHLWERCIRTCRKRNQVIRIEIGNGTGIRAIATMLARSASTISREIKRNTWFPSNENGSYRPYRPKRLKTGPWTGRYYIAGPARAAQGRTAQDEATQTASPVVRAPVDAGGRMAGMRLLSAAYQRQVACPVAG